MKTGASNTENELGNPPKKEVKKLIPRTVKKNV